MISRSKTCGRDRPGLAEQVEGGFVGRNRENAVHGHGHRVVAAGEAGRQDQPDVLRRRKGIGRGRNTEADLRHRALAMEHADLRRADDEAIAFGRWREARAREARPANRERRRWEASELFSAIPGSSSISGAAIASAGSCTEASAFPARLNIAVNGEAPAMYTSGSPRPAKLPSTMKPAFPAPRDGKLTRRAVGVVEGLKDRHPAGREQRECAAVHSRGHGEHVVRGARACIATEPEVAAEPIWRRPSASTAGPVPAVAA